MNKEPKLSRRQFLGQASCAAVGSTALFSTLLNLRMASTAAAQSAPIGEDDYKALVCLFMAGGADSYNFLAPYGQAEYDEYVAVRQNLALPRDQILPLTLAQPIGKELGLHPGMPNLRDRFNAGDLAWVANVGTLIEPTDLQQYEAQSVSLPLGLYSHADQIKQWQTSTPHNGNAIGWGGRTADLLHSLNDNDRISMNISIAGTNVWQSGNQSFAYAIGPDGARGLDRHDWTWSAYPARASAFDNLLDQEYANLFQRTFVQSTQSAIDAQAEYTAATEGITFKTQWPSPETNPIAAQLHRVAITIAARDALGMRRQTFFVQLGGWDHHDGVIEPMANMTPLIDEAVAAFVATMEEINEHPNVTMFSASDFGRTLTSNGKGSDHGWGGHQLVLGGGVAGGQVFGSYPELTVDNPLDVGRGRYIPTTSVDEYYAELARWLGIADADLPQVLPNLGRFYAVGSGIAPVGFML